MYEELTLENVREACQKHFAKRVEKGMVCDVLAGDQGPSCLRLEHLPDQKLFYVDFVKRTYEVEEDEIEFERKYDRLDSDMRVSSFIVSMCLH